MGQSHGLLGKCREHALSQNIIMQLQAPVVLEPRGIIRDHHQPPFSRALLRLFSVQVDQS